MPPSTLEELKTLVAHMYIEALENCITTEEWTLITDYDHAIVGTYALEYTKDHFYDEDENVIEMPYRMELCDLLVSRGLTKDRLKVACFEVLLFEFVRLSTCSEEVLRELGLQ